MSRLKWAARAVILVLVAVGDLASARAVAADPAGFSDRLVVGGLQAPTAFAFLPNGDILVAQRGGRVRHVHDGVLLADPVVTVGVSLNIERGLLGIAVDPAFTENGWVYLYYTSNDPVPVNRVVRFTFLDNVVTAGPTPILDNIPSVTGYHNAGALAFGVDGKLYISVGDSGQPANAQSLGTLAGKILRINKDGTIPADNPFTATPGARKEIWHYGLRNPFRFSIDVSGRMFIGDVGQASYEEIDVAEATDKGLNFGWPCREGLHEGPVPGGSCEQSPVSPIHEYSHAGATSGAASITGGAVSGTGVYPAPYAGALFFADFVRDFIDVLTYDPVTHSATVVRFGDDRPTTVHIVAAPDGRIYYASLALGEIRKLVHEAYPDVSPLTMTAEVTPTATQPRATALVTATVSTNSTSGLLVTADLSTIGGLAAQPLFDDSTSGDATAGDLVFSWSQRVGAAVPPGSRPLLVTVRDDLGRTATANATLTVQPIVDADADGLQDLCETAFGLDPATALSVNGAAGDFDNDGASNLAECAADTHPRGFFRRLFAEGVSSGFFTTEFAVANTRTVAPGQTSGVANAHVLFRFQRNDGVVVTHALTLPPQTRHTLDVSDLAGLSIAEFATVVESDIEVVVDRTVKWSRSSYGAHAEVGLKQASTTWFFAEGATHSGFSLFYLMQNPNGSPATVQVTYLRPQGQAPITIDYVVPAESRRTVWVNAANAALASTDVSARITSTLPIVAERAMYRDDGSGLLWSAGHGGAGAPALSTSWFFAEGATGPYFDLYLLLANPSSTAAQVTATYLRPSGPPVEKSYTVAPNSRRTIFVEGEHALLANTAVSTQLVVTNQVPIVAERAMWWPGPTSLTWTESHGALGAVATSPRWSLANGEVGGPLGADSYILIANLSPHAGQARVRLVLDDGTTREKTFNVAPASRRNVNVGADFPTVAGHAFGALVESVGTPVLSLAVERATYWDAGGVHWAAGTSALADVAEPADATLSLSGAGPSLSNLTVPVGGRLRVVNLDTTDRFLASTVPTACTAITPIGRLRPGESAVSGVFAAPQVCTLTDSLVGILPVTLTVP